MGKESSIVAEEAPNTEWKGIIYINLYGLLTSICLVAAREIYNKHPGLMPEQLLFYRGIISTLFCIVIVNKELKNALIIPQNQRRNLLLRCLQAASVLLINFSVIKYISLTFQGIS